MHYPSDVLAGAGWARRSDALVGTRLRQPRRRRARDPREDRDRRAPNAGKTTLFNALTRAGAETAVYPFTTVDQNVAVVEVPDERLAAVAEVVGASPAVPRDDRVPRHRGAGARRRPGRGAREPVPRRDPRDRRDLPRRARAHRRRRPPPPRRRRPAGRHRGGRSGADPRRPRAGGGAPRAGREAGRLGRRRRGRGARLARDVVDALGRGEPVRSVPPPDAARRCPRPPPGPDLEAGPVRRQRRRVRR